MKKCSIEGCERELRTRNLCQTHYARFIKHGDPMIGVPVRSKTSRKGVCQVIECSERIFAKKMCQKHHRRWIRHKNPTVRINGSNKGLICKEKECTHKARTKGFCSVHYAKFYRKHQKQQIKKIESLL